MKGRDHIIALEAISYISDLAWNVELNSISVDAVKVKIKKIKDTIDYLQEVYIDTITGENKI